MEKLLVKVQWKSMYPRTYNNLLATLIENEFIYIFH